jgi:hypothetical protein
MKKPLLIIVICLMTSGCFQARSNAPFRDPIRARSIVEYFEEKRERKRLTLPPFASSKHKEEGMGSCPYIAME